MSRLQFPLLLLDGVNLMVTARGGRCFFGCKAAVKTELIMVLKREESPCAVIFTTKKTERNPSINIITQHHRWQSSVCSTTVSNRDDLKANGLLIKGQMRADGAQLQECTLQKRQPSAMKPLRRLGSTAKSFHQAAPDLHSHIQTNTKTHKSFTLISTLI